MVPARKVRLFQGKVGFDGHLSDLAMGKALSSEDEKKHSASVLKSFPYGETRIIA
jgi:hypothetical protein